MTRNGIGVDLLKGAMAGAAATWLMGRTTTWLYGREDPSARQREEAARGDRSAYEAAAEQLAAMVGSSLGREQRARVGTALHWATGTAAGAMYAIARKRWPASTAAKGAAFGSAFFLVVDELLNPLLGWTPGPRAFPWQAHARGFAGHLAFGTATEFALEGLDRV